VPTSARLALAGVATAICVATSSAGARPQAPVQNARFGFAAGGNLQSFPPVTLRRYLDAARASHAGWIRIDLNWDVIQHHGPKRYDWSRFDKLISAITARRMRVLAGILYTPSWARAKGTAANYPPTNLAAYARFVRSVARRYAKKGVHAYEIWNEPNTATFWGPTPDPARYTRMLKLAYGAIKKADARATVVSAGLSPYGEYGQHDGEHINPLDFLEAMYAHGAGKWLDAVGWHPYNYPFGLGFAESSAWSQMSETNPSARTIMATHGDEAKQLWPTEFGFPTGSTSRDVSEATQAQLVTNAYTILKSRPWTGPAFFYSFHDSGTNKLDVEHNFGVVRHDFSPKPSYDAYQAVALAG
jgi:exo-beta-1,3-glucanase (GH17 family)